VFFQGWLWDINSFDQFGVELGKQMATEVRAEIEGRVAPHSDSSTRLLAEWFQRHRPTAGG
jgi:glucose-6-phosphate isomerase